MANKWNKQQLLAIDTFGGSIAVSAAAGSGKTAVMVERIIKHIIDRRVSANRLLVVTFTRAAAAELRQRIASAIDSRIELTEDESERLWLHKQKNLLPVAKITTIDSFCLSLVKENYQALHINQDIEILSNEEVKVYSNEILEQTLEELFADEKSDIAFLSDLLNTSKSDKLLKETILNLHSNADAFAFFDNWIDSLHFENITENEDIYLSTCFDIVIECAQYCSDLCCIALQQTQNIKELEKLYDLLLIESQWFDDLIQASKNRDLDSYLEIFSSFKFSRAPSLRLQDDLVEIKSDALTARNQYKDIVKKVIGIMPFGDDNTLKSDNEYVSRIINALIYAVKKYDENLKCFKMENNRFTFNDILHMSINLLADVQNDGSVLPSNLAQELKNQFFEICIDEYQDTNSAQDMVFSLISNNNIFCVGDVKQSIYRFRKAQPEIFLQKINSYNPLLGQNAQFPAKIILQNNYRSRKSVTNFTNYVFSKIMSKSFGDIEYSADEHLVPSFPYVETDEAVELHLIERKTEDDDSNSSKIQARYIAELIHNKVKSGFLIEDKKTHQFRPCRYGDFTVLSRSISSLGPNLVECLNELNIGSYTEVKSEFFSSYEITLMMNLLKIIDNPKQDIPLLSVMMSFLYGFTPDDLAIMKNNTEKGQDIYSMLLQNNDEKVQKFLNDISKWRKLSITSSTPDFIRTIYNDTDIENFVLFMKSPNVKRSNLSLLLFYAGQYESLGYTGLSGFIRYTDKLQNMQLDLQGSLDKSSNSDVVNIMTIHKSKGLQAPIVIVADIQRKFNIRDIIEPIIVSPKIGLGVKKKDVSVDGIEYIKRTVNYEAVKRRELEDMKAEELRVLYVALTRAEQRLILVGSVNNISSSEKLPLASFCSNLIETNGKINSMQVFNANSYLHWILASIVHHPDASIIRKLAGVDEKHFTSDFNLEIYIDHSFQEQSSEQKINEIPNEKLNKSLLDVIKSAVEYEYPYLPLTKQISKQAASSSTLISAGSPYFASKKPVFAQKSGFSAAEKGTFTHRFMEFVDFDAINLQDIEASLHQELQRMEKQFIFSCQEAKSINISALKRFFSSKIYDRMKKSKELYREKKFTIYLPIDYFDPELAPFSNEQLTIQGVVDAAFEEDNSIVIVDYKTDRINDENELIAHYKQQIGIYKQAMIACTDYDSVKAMYLYSFHLNKLIEVK